MICCSCFTFERIKIYNKKGESEPGVSNNDTEATPALHRHEKLPKFPTEAAYNREATNNKNIQAQTFTFRELAAATKNFRQETMLGEGGFGRVYKGQLAKLGQTVAVKQLDRNGMQGNKEFLVEVLMLSQMHHQNLVKLIGYCADGDQRLLVYEFMQLGSLEDHLLDLQPEDIPLNWFTRLKIALGAAKGLEYLHDKANPPVIYRDLKSSNILLDKEYNAKLSDFGLAKLGPLGEKTHVSSRVMGTYGYCAPEYQRTGQLTLKSDVYSFGVVLLEIITGRRAVDPTRRIDEQNLVSWAEQYFRDPSKYPELADPLLEENYPIKSLNQVVAMASMCLQEEASVRPLISDVVTALSFLGQGPEQPPPQQDPAPNLSLPQQTPTTAPILVPPQPVPAPTYDIAPALPPAREETSPVHEQVPVPSHAPPKDQAPPHVAPNLAFSKSSPAVLPHWKIPNTIYSDNEQEYITESDSNSDDESYESESDEEDHKDEVKEKDHHEEHVTEAEDWCLTLRNDEDENNTENDSNSDSESYENESEEEDHKDEAKEKNDHEEDVIEAKDWCSTLMNERQRTSVANPLGLA